jgi:uncharacterized LabA/DUF88 family protein
MLRHVAKSAPRVFVIATRLNHAGVNGINGTATTPEALPSTAIQVDSSHARAPRAANWPPAAAAPQKAPPRENYTAPILVKDLEEAPRRPPPSSLALLIDAENAQPSTLPLVLQRLASHYALPLDNISIRRIYGNSAILSTSAWQELMRDYSLRASHSTQGTADADLMVDAMDILHTSPHIDGFLVVSSDGDFIRLIQRLREDNKTVIGVGHRKKLASTNKLVKACHQYVYTEDVVEVVLEEERQARRAAREEEKRIIENEENEKRVQERNIQWEETTKSQQRLAEEEKQLAVEKSRARSMAGRIERWRELFWALVSGSTRSNVLKPDDSSLDSERTVESNTSTILLENDTGMHSKDTDTPAKDTVTATNSPAPLSKEDMDTLVEGIEIESRNASARRPGWAIASRVAQFVDYKKYGHERLGALLVELPKDTFEVQKRRSVLFVRLRKPGDVLSEKDRTKLCKGIDAHSNEEGWAVASKLSNCIDCEKYGHEHVYSLFQELLGEGFEVQAIDRVLSIRRKRVDVFSVDEFIEVVQANSTVNGWALVRDVLKVVDFERYGHATVTDFLQDLPDKTFEVERRRTEFGNPLLIRYNQAGGD